jgi:hypothetical protein
MPTIAGARSSAAPQLVYLSFQSVDLPRASDLHPPPRVRAERLAHLSDCASRLGRKKVAERFLLLAWQAYDEEDTLEEGLSSAANTHLRAACSRAKSLGSVI